MVLALFGPAANIMPPPLSDDEVFGTASAAPAVVPPPQAHTLAPPVPLNDDQVFGTAEAPAPVAPPSIWDRIKGNFEDSFTNGGGAIANFLDSQIQGGVQNQLREEGLGENADALQRGVEKQRGEIQDRYANIPSFTAAPTLAGKVQQGAAALAGQVAGAVADPFGLGLITDIPGVSKVIAPVVEKVLPKAVVPVATRVAEAGASQAGVNTAVDAGAQTLNVASGDQKGFDPVQLALAPALGFLVGGSLHGGGEALRGMADAFRAWRAAKGAPAGKAATDAAGSPETAPSPEDIDAFSGSPEMAAYLKANGITDPADPRVIQLQDRLAARKEGPTPAPQDASGAKLSAFHKDQARLQADKEAVAEGEANPATLSTAGRVARPDLPASIPVTPEGQADVGDLGVKAGIDNAATVKAGVQDQASEAFRLAELQRTRSGAAVRDTQPAARPEGVNAQPVTLDEGFPVKVLSRSIKDVGGQKVDMATVHRYDPRTDQVDPEAVPYDVPVRQLKTANYAKQPRQSQDFAARAEGPGNPETPRMAEQPVKREPDQTYRTTAEDPNAEFPGATQPGPEDGNPPEGRSPLPKQPEGPGPFRQRSRSEEEAIRDFEARQRDPNDAEYRARRAEGPRAGDAKTSTKAAKQDAEGRFPVDDRAYVQSDKGGPVKFADQKQAAKWIINEGHKKSPDQIFEIENHPSGKGFTVHERGRAEAKPETEASRGGDTRGSARAAESASPDASTPREAPRLSGPAAEAAKPERGPKTMAADSRASRGTLFDAIREKGGIKDDRGDVNQIMQGFKNPRFKKRVVNPNGLHPDKMRAALQEEGWFGSADRHGSAALETGKYPGDDLKDLYNLMDREARGEKIFHPESTPSDKELMKVADDIGDEEATRAGVTDKDTPLEAHQKLADYRASVAHDFQIRENMRKINELLDPFTGTDRENLNDEGWQREDVGAGEEEPGGDAARARQSNDIPGWEEDAGASDHSASGTEPGAGTRAGADAAHEGVEQTRVEGTEHEAAPDELKARARARDAEEHQQNPRAYSGKAQKGHADDGLFGDKSEKDQNDLFNDATPEQQEAANKLRDKFSANPAFDPESWKEVGRTLTKLFKWPAEEAEAFTRHWQGMVDAWPKAGPVKEADAKAGLLKKGANAVYPLWHGAKILIGSNDGVLRSIAFRRNSKAVLEIANHFFAGPKRAERGKAHAEDYFLSTTTRHNQFVNRVDELLKPFNKLKTDEHQSALTQVGRLITNPGAIKPGTPIHDAAAGMSKILKEIHTYMREAGVEVGEVKRGYLPRVENVDKVLASPEGFKAAAVKTYRADGVPLKDAKKSADEWFNRLLLGDLGIQHGGNDFMQVGGSSQHPAFTKGRELSKKADDIMGDYYLRNPADIMPRYITKAVKAAEWERRFGKRDAGTPVPKGEDKATFLSEPLGKWKDYKQRMIAEGAGEDIPEVVRIIKSMTGNIGQAAMSHTARNTLSLVRTLGALSYLPHATMSSLSEPVSMAIRTGNPLDIMRGFGNTVRHWVPALRKVGQGPYLKEMALDLGFIGDSMDGLSMLQRVGNEDNTLWARRLQSNFFRQSGLTQFTEAERISAMQMGMTFMRRLASDVANKSHFENMARNQLAELGIGESGNSKDGVEAFSRWVMDRDGKPHLNDIVEGGAMGQLYHTALGRFISQSVMHPTGALKPRYAQHPVGSLFYGLQSFNYSFQKNILNRVASMTMDAVDPKSGLNGRERMASLMPLATLPLLFGIQYALGEIRNAAFPDPAREGQPAQTTWNKALTAVSRSGLDGIMDPYLNIFTQARYTRDPTLALQGPFFSVPGNLVADTAALAQSSGNTNTARRKMMRDIYDLGIKPALLAGVAHVSTETPLLTLLGAAAVQGLSHPVVREDFVRPLAGAPEPPKGATGFNANDFKGGAGLSASDFK